MYDLVNLKQYNIFCVIFLYLFSFSCVANQSCFCIQFFNLKSFKKEL